MKAKNTVKITSVIIEIDDLKHAINRMEMAIQRHSSMVGITPLNYEIADGVVQRDYFTRQEMITIFVIRKLALEKDLDKANKVLERL